jgi:hypothetical protein
MDSAITAAGNNRVAASAYSLLGQRAGAVGRKGLQRFGFNARFAQDGKRLVDGRTTPVEVLA